LAPGQQRIHGENADELDGVVERQKAFFQVVQFDDHRFSRGRVENDVVQFLFAVAQFDGLRFSRGSVENGRSVVVGPSIFFNSHAMTIRRKGN
jgi:hypothetical protein